MCAAGRGAWGQSARGEGKKAGSRGAARGRARAAWRMAKGVGRRREPRHAHPLWPPALARLPPATRPSVLLASASAWPLASSPPACSLLTDAHGPVPHPAAHSSLVAVVAVEHQAQRVRKGLYIKIAFCQAPPPATGARSRSLSTDPAQCPATAVPTGHWPFAIGPPNALSSASRRVCLICSHLSLPASPHHASPLLARQRRQPAATRRPRHPATTRARLATPLRGCGIPASHRRTGEQNPRDSKLHERVRVSGIQLTRIRRTSYIPPAHVHAPDRLQRRQQLHGLHTYTSILLAAHAERIQAATSAPATPCAPGAAPIGSGAQ